MTEQPDVFAIPDLDFAIEGVEPVRYAASPLLMFKLAVRQVTQVTPPEIQAVTLRCQIRIDPLRRRYADDVGVGMQDMFGPPNRWGNTMRSLLWQHVSIVVPPFVEATTVDLAVPCLYDFNLASTKYFDSLRDGFIPLSFYFSGTIFYQAPQGPLQAAQISWEKEARFQLTLDTWRQMMDHYYPNSVWLCVPRDVFERVQQHKHAHSIPAWDEALARLVEAEATGTEK